MIYLVGFVNCQTGIQCVQDHQQGGQVRGSQGRDHPGHCQVGEGASQGHPDTDTGGGGQAD